MWWDNGYGYGGGGNGWNNWGRRGRGGRQQKREWTSCECGNWVFNDRNIKYCRVCGKEICYDVDDLAVTPPELASADLGAVGEAVDAAQTVGLKRDQRMRAAVLLLQQDPALLNVAKSVEASRKGLVAKPTVAAAVSPPVQETFSKSNTKCESLNKSVKAAEKKGAALAAKCASLRRQLAEVEQSCKQNDELLGTARKDYDSHLQEHWRQYPNGCPREVAASSPAPAADDGLAALRQRLVAAGDVAGVALLGRYLPPGSGGAGVCEQGAGGAVQGSGAVGASTPTGNTGAATSANGGTQASLSGGAAPSLPTSGTMASASTIPVARPGVPGTPPGDSTALAGNVAASEVSAGNSAIVYPRPYGIGAIVQIKDLTTDAVRFLNGTRATVDDYGLSSGAWRAAVILSDSGKKINLKLANLCWPPTTLDDEEGDSHAEDDEDEDDDDVWADGNGVFREGDDPDDDDGMQNLRKFGRSKRPDPAKRARGDAAAASGLAADICAAVDQAARG